MNDLISEARSLGVQLSPEPAVSARAAGLAYVSDDEPGIRRKKWGRGFTFLDAEGRHIDETDLRRRCEKLAIPPAWRDVWICPDPAGHIQVTGRDDAGRKQYIYHPRWEEVRSRVKFDRLIPFGSALPELRARSSDDLKRDGLPRAKVLALVVRLLECTLIRIGNDEYADVNESFGLTTMRDRHVSFDDDGCRFEFSGKSGQHQCIRVSDLELAGAIRDCRDIPGYEIFQFFDEGGAKQDVKSHHINHYLNEATGLALTAKDFRPWGATLLAAQILVSIGGASQASDSEIDAHIIDTIDQVAEQLGNTRSVCREYYIHPNVTEGFRDGTLAETWQRLSGVTPHRRHSADEHRLLHFLVDQYKARS